jgi:hypothetical protein
MSKTLMKAKHRRDGTVDSYADITSSRELSSVPLR